MQKPRISLIAAIGNNRELGKKGDLIWRIPADLKRVKELTTGHPIIMGRKTYDSIGHPLPNRTNIVISRLSPSIDGCMVVDSVENALTAAQKIDTEEIFIFGGAHIYEQALPYVDRLYLTLIHAEDTDADTYFPDFGTYTKEVSREDYPEHTPPFTWVTLEKEN